MAENNQFTDEELVLEVQRVSRLKPQPAEFWTWGKKGTIFHVVSGRKHRQA